MGHPFETWTHGNGKMWLKDFLADDLPSARIMTFGYDSAVAFGKSVGDIEDNALSLLYQLRAERPTSGSEGHDGRPIVFVCHSLGGIIVKKAMVLAHERSSEPAFKDILDNTKAMAFLSVPHRGFDAAWWGNLDENVLKNVSMGKLTSNVLIKDLKRNSPALMDISRQFVLRSQNLKIYAFDELRKTGPILVVDQSSATIGISNERLFPVNADHHTICRLGSGESHAYKAVGSHVVLLVKSVAPVVMHERPLEGAQQTPPQRRRLHDPRGDDDSTIGNQRASDFPIEMGYTYRVSRPPWSDRDQVVETRRTDNSFEWVYRG